MTFVEAVIAVVLIGGCAAFGATAAGVFYMLDVHRMKQRQTNQDH